MDHIASRGNTPCVASLEVLVPYASAGFLGRHCAVSSFGPQNEAEKSGIEQSESTDSLLTKYAFNVECSSADYTWAERCLVEVRARTAQDARHHVIFSLDDFEQIVSPVLRVA
jgi:hypothetical protein